MNGKGRSGARGYCARTTIEASSQAACSTVLRVVPGAAMDHSNTQPTARPARNPSAVLHRHFGRAVVEGKCGSPCLCSEQSVDLPPTIGEMLRASIRPSLRACWMTSTGHSASALGALSTKSGPDNRGPRWPSAPTVTAHAEHRAVRVGRGAQVPRLHVTELVTGGALG
ncbi:hypothetical protein K458DRAFT_150371 [Lentithecium fluviatile CBS 122367]|uniref:Uncharacterized protein n=1 Tax=Lentithecium fluviatile CBS 122367 TaxID=1168545 RepID=A0A6G1JEN3_9PLEO|nr:hypothetical protein K458DRAFT_150371 [Lentithecium fluviatile CBS 122367]